MRRAAMFLLGAAIYVAFFGLLILSFLPRLP